MLDKYDFSKGVRGKYAKRYAEVANAVVLDPPVKCRYLTAGPQASLSSHWNKMRTLSNRTVYP